MNISTFTSFCLKIAGLICILSFFLDVILFAIPFKVQDPAWQVDFVTNIVDRGVVPMVGTAFILIATWVDGTLRDTGSKSGFDLRLPTFILASILGLIFLVLIPIHINNINQVKTLNFEQIKKDVDQSEQQIQTFLGRLTTLSQNPQLLDQEVQQRTRVIETGQFQGRQLTAEEQAVLRQQRDYLQNLRNLSKTPKEFKKKIDEIKTTAQTQLQDRRKQVEGQETWKAYKQALRIGLQSLMLTIGFSAIGWLGLRGVGGLPKRSA